MSLRLDPATRVAAGVKTGTGMKIVAERESWEKGTRELGTE